MNARAHALVADVRAILERHPGMAEILAEVVNSRQAVLVEKARESQAPALEKSGILSRKIREFFNLR